MACDSNGGIAYKNELPWRVRDDEIFYIEMIKNKVIVLGYKTYLNMSEEILSCCHWVIFSHNPDRKPRNDCEHSTTFVSGIEDFIKMDIFGQDIEFYMIGGAEIASLFLQHNLIDQFFITHINKQCISDQFIPLDKVIWWPQKCLQQTDECSFNYYMNPLSPNLSWTSLP
jgi:dihydrofolate reductase